ncbi:MAG: flagellin [Sphingobium sp.]|nr:flagellin [Sphingobium sp.]
MVFITSQSLNAEILRQQNLARDIATEQTKISTGKKINQPADNPQDWVQISQIGRQQSINDAWASNANFANSRATAASSSLGDINALMSKVTELLVQSTSTSQASPGREAVAQSIEGIKQSIHDLLHQTDYQGSPIFDDTNTVNIPVGAGLAVDAVATRQSISDNVVGTKSLDDILQAAIDAVRNSDDAALKQSLTDSRAALDHVIVAQSIQGVRQQRIDDIATRINNKKLDLTERRSSLEDTDVGEVITKLQSKLTTLEASQAAFARIGRQSLFDLLR